MENSTVKLVHIRGRDNVSDFGTKSVAIEKDVIDRPLRFHVGLEDELPEHIPPMNKNKLEKAAEDAAQMNAFGVNQIAVANAARLQL